MTGQSLFELLLRTPEVERAALLDRACVGKPELRAEVQALLKANAPSPPMIDQPTANEVTTGFGPTQNYSSIEPTAGVVIASRYSLEHKLGEGGMGEVWIAKQSQPVKRRVALKLIKAGMDSKSVLQRFEQERQALALMDHPNIAKVLDGGLTQDRRPFFVMELVNGSPLTKFCDDAKLGIRERLEIFIPICQAVQHAHQKGIVHRDLKPSNILVTMVDGKPVPKVIDFGVAKATAGKLTEDSLSTQFGAVVGTFEYMSPEQAVFSGEDIDTRADIYSLGVILYELLTGLRPIDAKRLKKAALTEMIRIIQEEDPSKPSTRLSTDDSAPSMAALRHTEPRKLVLLLRGELDWVVMKCLEKDRNRRYETANGLTMEIQRYLAGEPVLAAPPSSAYRFRKFIARNRTTALAIAAVSIALLLGAIGFAWQAHRASIQRDVALAAQESEAEQRRIAEDQRTAADRQRNRAVAAEAEAQRRAMELQQVADFQGKMLAQVDPSAAGVRLSEDVRKRLNGSLTKAGVPDAQRKTESDSFAGQWSRINATDAALDLIDQTILKPAVAAIDKQFADQPAVAARLREVLAERYHDLGLDQAALTLEQQTLEVRRRVLGEDHPETLTSLNNTGSYLNALGKAKEAENYYRQAFEKSRRVRGEDDPETLVCKSNLGSILREMGKLSEAEPYLREALEKRRRLLGESHKDTLVSLSEQGMLLKDQGKLAEAEKYYREVLDKRRVALGEDNDSTVYSINNLATLLKDQGKLEESVKYFKQVVEKRRKKLGDVHPKTLTSIQNLGATLDATGHPAEAEALMREALANQRRLLGPDHHSTLTTLGNLSVSLIGQNKMADAEPLCRETLERRRRVMGVDHQATLIANNVMGLVLVRQNKEAEAEPYWRETMLIGQRVLGPAHPDTLIFTHNLARLMNDQKKYEEAEKLYRQVIDQGGPAIGLGHPTVLSATRNLSGILLQQKHYSEVVDLLSKAEPAARKSYTGANARFLGALLENLGRSRAQLGQYSAAEANLLEAQGIYLKTRGPTHADTRNNTRVLVEFYTQRDKTEPGKGFDAKAAEWKKKLDAIKPPEKPAEKK